MSSITTLSLKKPARLNLDHYRLISPLGQGAFGTVFLAKNTTTNTYCAFKQLKKIHVLRTKQTDHLRNEIYILASISHPFIVKTQGIAQDQKYLYISMEYIPGGTLFDLLRKTGRFPTHQAQFYAAQVVLTLEYLHSLDIIYRDLKPENLLIHTDGYLTLTDFGFAKIVPLRTYTLCGTPGYIAPEVLLQKGHGKAADWWALGVLLYEMLVGIDPFSADEPMQVY